MFSFLNPSWLIFPKDILVKGLKFIWKVLSRPADGKITTARKNTQPKLCCRTSPATWCCLMVAAMAFLPAATMSSPVRLPIPDGITPRRLLLLLIWTMIFRSKLLITKKRFVTEPLFCYILCSPCKSQGAGTTPLCAADYPLGFAGEYLCQSFLCFKWRFFAFFCFFC